MAGLATGVAVAYGVRTAGGAVAGSVAGISAGTVVRVRVGRGAETMAVVTVGGTGAMAVGPSAIVGEIWSVSCLVQSNNDGYVPCPLRVA